MRLKTALTGLVASIAVAIPVVAGNLPNNGHPIGTSVTYYPNRPPSGLFANWMHAGHPWLLSFGVTNDDQSFASAGLRIDAPNAQKAKTFQFDINTTNSNNPFIEVWATNPGATGPNLFVSDDLSDLGPSDGFEFKPLKNGFTRVTFTASDNSDFQTKTAFSSIYIADFTNFHGSFSDQLTNVSVNHTDVVANVQPRPEYDSTLDF